MKKTTRRRITVTSSLIEISLNLLGNRVVVRAPPLSTAGYWTDI
jgi:hypothetical protein